MGMFDGLGVDGPAPTNAAEMIRGGARSLGKAVLDPIMERQGFASKENRIMEAMQGVNIEDAKSVSDTFSKIMEIDPQAAAEFQAQVMPMLTANQTAAASDSVGTLRKTLDTSAYIIGCNLNDPDKSKADKCRKDSYAHSLNYKRLNEFDKASAINLADDLNVQLGLASTAVDDIAQFDQMLTILPQIYTGFGSEAIATPVARIADFFGVDKTMAGKRELFASNAMDMALGYIAQTKGAISDTEFQAFQDATAGLKKTKVGNDLIIRTAREYARYRKNKGAEMARWSAAERDAGRTPTQAQWGTHLAEWSNKEENKPKLPTSSEIAKGLEIPADQLIEDTALQIQETEDLLAELNALQAAAGGQ